MARIMTDYFGSKYQINVFSMRRVERSENILVSSDARIHYGSDNNLVLFYKIFKYFRSNRHNGIFHLLNAGPIILLLCRMAGIRRIIYHIHGTVYFKTTFQNLFGRGLWKIALNRYVRVIANSEYSKLVFIEKISDKCLVEVIYNPVKSPGKSISNALKKESDELSICYMGRLSREKNLFAWLDAAREISLHYSNCSFHLYGYGPEEEDLKRYSESLGIAGKVHFEGYVEDIDKEYKKHKLLLFLSGKESFGNVVVESILAGVPVLVSAIPSMLEICRGFPEFIVEMDNKYRESIIQKINRMEELEEAAEIARVVFIKRFSEKGFLERMSDIYLNYSNGPY